MGTRHFTKDPDSVLDYVVDWTAWLADVSPVDTISTSSWTLQSGLTLDSDSNTSQIAKAWVSGGTAGTRYKATNRIVTAGARTADRTIYITVRER